MSFAIFFLVQCVLLSWCSERLLLGNHDGDPLAAMFVIMDDGGVSQASSTARCADAW